MISEFNNDETLYGALINKFEKTSENIFGDPSAELREALKMVLGDCSEQAEVENVLERIVQDLFLQASRDNSAIEKHNQNSILNYSNLKLLKEFIERYEKTIGICLSLQGSAKEGEMCILKAMILVTVEEFKIALHYYEQAATLS